jgi:hypothetical protein
MHGEGVIFLTNGEKFMGSFSEGVINGEGCYTTVN